MADQKFPNMYFSSTDAIFRGCHSAFFEKVCQKQNDSAVLGLFWMLRKIVYFKACFKEIWAKLAIIDEILTFNLVILTNFLPKFDLYLAFFGLYFVFIWPFFIFEDLAFLKLLMAKLGLLNFSGPGNPAIFIRKEHSFKVSSSYHLWCLLVFISLITCSSVQIL